MSRSPGCARRAGEAGASRCPRSRGLLRLFRRSETRRCRPRGPACRSPHTPFVLPSRGGTGARLPGPLSLWIWRVGPAVRPGRETLHPAGGPAEAWGPEKMGKRAPFFPVPAILRLRFSRGARVANHTALGARLVAGSGDERLRALRASSPECSGSARRDPHLHFQGLEPRAPVNSPNRPEAQVIRGTRAGS